MHVELDSSVLIGKILGNKSEPRKDTQTFVQCWAQANLSAVRIVQTRWLPSRSSPTGKFPRVPPLVFLRRRNTHLTSLPLVSICRYDRVTQRKVHIKCHFEWKLHFPSAQLILRQMHLAKSIGAKYQVSWLIRAIMKGSGMLSWMYW